MSTRAEVWQNNLWSDMLQNDDDDADSDTDSRLSGSVIVDSVMRRLQRGYASDHSGFKLDPIADHSLDDTDVTHSYQPNGTTANPYNYHQQHQQQQQRRITEPSLLPNGYHGGRSPLQGRRIPAPRIPGSPKSHHPRSFGGAGHHGGTPNRRNDGLLHPFTAGGRRKDHVLLSPVPENLLGGPDKTHPLDSGMHPMNVVRSSHNTDTSRSMETVPINRRQSPTNIHRSPPDGYRSPGLYYSPDGMSRSHSEHNKLPAVNIGGPRRGSLDSPYHPVGVGGPIGRSPQLSSRFKHGGYLGNVSPKHNAHHEVIEHQVSSIGHIVPNSREPNLNDVVDYLSSNDPLVVSNAASYLQHLAYRDDSMKAKIRQFGGIPALVNQLRNSDLRVQLAVLNAIRNLSYGRANNDNKIQIANDTGLPGLSYLLRTTHHPEVRELVTCVLWNLSSCDEIKMRIVQSTLKEITDTILIPQTGYNPSHIAARDFSIRPNVLNWSTEMRNSLGTLRNISSAGEDARRYLRRADGLIDVLVWIVRAASGQENTDEKTAENAVCILRNLSFQIETEIDPQEGADDIRDKEWERQILHEIEEAAASIQTDNKKGRSFLLFCTRPKTADNIRRTIPRLTQPQNLSNPASSLLPKHSQPVRGMALLWQPEIVFPYLALLEKYCSSPELLEGAAGAIQNLTACTWKWAEYQRHLVRKSQGLALLIELLNHAHDTVVRSASTALRNLSLDSTNKVVIGWYGIQSIIPRLPYGQNSLGISEATTISLLCTAAELCTESNENTRVFREAGGITPVVRLTQSREHTFKIVYSAHKLCAALYELKSSKSSLKQEGWDMREYQRLTAEESHQLNNQSDAATPSHVIKKENAISRTRSNSDPNTMIKQNSSSSLGHLPPLPHVPPASPVENIPVTYQMIPEPKTSVAPAVNATNSTGPALTEIPVSMYAEINDPQLQFVKKNSSSENFVPPRSDSQARSHTTSESQPHSEPRSSPLDAAAVANGGSTEFLSLSDDQLGGDAMYAQVDYEKKREGRRRKEELQRQQQQSAASLRITEAIDSWV